MKIGIITWFSYENYGTKLQAIALQNYLTELGFRTELINFLPPVYEEIKENRSLFEKIGGRIKRHICEYGKKKYKDDIEQRSLNFQKVIEELCVLSQEIRDEDDYVKVCNQYDCLICGSDQIWNPQWLHPFYYAAYNTIQVKKIAYAPSIGVEEIDEKDCVKYRTYLKDFCAIGMREQTGQRKIQTLYHKKVEEVVDPTLLLSARQWERIFNIQEKEFCEEYICVYFLGDRKNHWKAVHEFSACRKLGIKIIPQIGTSYIQKGEIIARASVREFVDCIRNARFVITDSFHATIFSIIFRKEFFVIERFDQQSELSQNSRIYDFLKILGLEDRIHKYDTNKINEQLGCDYRNNLEQLELKIKQSKDFIEKSLECTNRC